MKILIGFFLAVLLSPLLLWFGQSQHTERDFLRSRDVSADTLQDGYVSITGLPVVVSELNCPIINTTDVVMPCLFVKSEVLEYQTTSSTVCGQTKPVEPWRVKRQVADRCDEDGYGCETCYEVEKDEWVSLDNQKTFVPFQIGLFKIVPTEKTKFINELNGEYFTNLNGERRNITTSPTIGDKDYKFTYFPLPKNILAAGLAAEGVIESAGDGEVFVISEKSRVATAAVLKEKDKMASSFFTYLSLLLMFLGFGLMASPFSVWLKHVFGALLPGLDKLLGRGAGFLIFVISGLLGGVIWLVLFLAILFAKNLFWIVGLIAVIGVLVLLLTNNKTLNTRRSSAK